jgi:hypothetical protein
MLLDILFNEFNYIFLGPMSSWMAHLFGMNFFSRQEISPCGLKPCSWALETISVGCVAINVPQKRVLLK